MAKGLIACVWAVALTVPVWGQKLVEIGEYTSAHGDVQLLPGPMVIVRNDLTDGKTNLYQYRSGKLVRTGRPLSKALKSWRSFSWESVDQYNQLDLRFWVTSSISAFLPSHSKVKAYATIPGLEADQTIVILCYAVPPDPDPEQDPTTGGGPRNLHLLMMSREPGPAYADTVYTKLADVLVAEEAAFGTMLVEREPTGTFAAVYFLEAGSGDYESMGVFAVRPNRARRPKGAH